MTFLGGGLFREPRISLRTKIEMPTGSGPPCLVLVPAICEDKSLEKIAAGKGRRDARMISHFCNSWGVSVAISDNARLASARFFTSQLGT